MLTDPNIDPLETLTEHRDLKFPFLATPPDGKATARIATMGDGFRICGEACNNQGPYPMMTLAGAYASFLAAHGWTIQKE